MFNGTWIDRYKNKWEKDMPFFFAKFLSSEEIQFFL